MYNTNLSGHEQLYDVIDSEIIKKQLELYFKPLTDHKLEKKIKHHIEHLSTFAELTGSLKVPSHELIRNVFIIYPQIFSHHCIKKIRSFV